MTQRIFILHGRSTKPAQAPFAKLQKKALLVGLDRIDPTKADKIRSGDVKVDVLYYGHVTNRLLAAQSRYGKRMTDTDPTHGDAACLPTTGLSDAIDAVAAIPNLNKLAYETILRENDGRSLIDNAARALSVIASLFTGGGVNTAVYNNATLDLGKYFDDQDIGSEIRSVLTDPLRLAILRGDDVCLLTHSMGTIVGYDVLFKISHRSEYADVQEANNPVSRWVTMGSPLGDPGVRSQLLDAKMRGKDKYPRHIVRKWINISAKDDIIALDQTLAGNFKEMKSLGFIHDINDIKKIYNCYANGNVANPHNLFGYLAHDKTGKVVADWIN